MRSIQEADVPMLTGERRPDRAIPVAGLRTAPQVDGPAVLMLTDNPGGAVAVVPSAASLHPQVSVEPLTWAGAAEDADVLLVDGTGPIGDTLAACRSSAVVASQRPVVLVVDPGALAVVQLSWRFDDWLMATCEPAELRTRLRLVCEEADAPPPGSSTAAGIAIDARSCSATVHGQQLNLTFTEFQLLAALVSRPGQVWTRASLLRDVWGYAHRPGDTRTVDVHIRRLRAKLGPEAAASIETVRNVGYRLSARPPDG